MQLLPTQEEAVAASLLESVIADAIADIDRFDVLDDLDLIEQLPLPVTVTGTERQKRGVDRKSS